MYSNGGDGDDDGNPPVPPGQTSATAQGGTGAGVYKPEDPNLRIPGETQGVDDSQLG